MKRLTLIFYINQYLFRFIKGKYDYKRTMTEILFELWAYENYWKFKN